MLYPLQEDAYDRIRFVCRNLLKSNLVVASILDRHTPAWVFVDDTEQPKTAALWNKQDALLLAGDAHNEAFNAAFGEVFTQRIMPDAQRRYIPELTLFYDSAAWETLLDTLLQGREAVKASRRYYTSSHLPTDFRGPVPADCAVRPIDAPLLAADALQNIEQVRGWVESFWRSHQDFVDTCFGYCLIKEEAILSWCLTVYVSGSHFELGLATVPEARRQGYAALTALACVEHGHANGLTLHWHCWNDNLGSIATAKKVGFADPVMYDVYKVGI